MDGLYTTHGRHAFKGKDYDMKRITREELNKSNVAGGCKKSCRKPAQQPAPNPFETRQ